MRSRFKKIIRWGGVVAGLMAVVIGAVLFYITRPGVQRDFALNYLQEQGIAAEIGAVQAGLGGAVSLDDLVLKLPAGRIACKRGRMEVALLPLLGKRINIASLTLDGLEVDLTDKTPGKPKPEESSSGDDTGAMPELLIHLKKAEINNGSIRLESGEQFNFSLKGYDIDSTTRGDVTFTVSETEGRKRTVEGELAWVFATPAKRIPGSVEDVLAARPEVALKATLSNAAGARLPVSASFAPARHNYSWEVSLQPATGKTVLRSTGEIKSNGAMQGSLEANLVAADLALLLDASAVPDFRLNGIARLARVSAQEPGALQFDFTGAVAQLNRAHATLAAVPSLDFKLAGQVSGTESAIRFENLELALNSPGAAPVAHVALAQPAELKNVNDTWTPVFPAGDLLVLTLEKFPLPLANAFFPETDGAWRVDSGAISAALLISATDSTSATLRTRTPIFLENLAVSQANAAYLRNINGEVPLRFEISQGNWKMDTEGLVLKSGTRALLDARAKIGAVLGKPTDFDVTATVHADGLAAQPAWAEVLRGFSGDDWRGTFYAKGALSTGVVLTEANLIAVQGTGQPLLRAVLLQSFDTVQQAASEGKPLLRVEADKFPLALATPFLGGARLGGTAGGTIELTKTADRVRLHTPGNATISLRAVSYTDSTGKAKLADMHLHSKAAVSFGIGGGVGWDVDFSEGKIDAGDGRPLSGSLAMTWTDCLQSVRAHLEGDPARLLHQPLLGGFTNLASARLSLQGSYTHTGACDIQLALENLTGHGDIGSLRKVTLSATGVLDPVKPSLMLPCVVEGATLTSDAALGVSTEPDGQWKINLKGAQINVPDIQRLVAIFTPSMDDGPTFAETTPSKNDTPDPAPFWGELRGVGTVDVKKIIFPELTADDVQARLVVSGTALALETLSARAAEGIVNGKGRLDFKATQPQTPYVLAGELALLNLPFRNCIALFSPGESDILEGRFNTTVVFSGVAPNLDLLLDGLGGRLDFSSQKGRVRIFKMDNSLVRVTGDLAELAGGVADIVSGLARNKRTEKYMAPIQAFSEVQKYLADFPFDQVRLQAERAALGDIKISRMQIINDQLSIEGSGMIGHRAGVAFADSPLTLNARLDARDKLATLLNQLKLLQGGQNTAGYYAGPGFELSGSLNSLQNNLLSTLLDAARAVAAQTGARLDLNDSGGASGEKPGNTADQVLDIGSEILRGFGL